MVADTSDDMFWYICNTADVSSTEIVCLAGLLSKNETKRKGVGEFILNLSSGSLLS